MTTCDPVVAAHKRLACAIVARAVRDARSGNGHTANARRWLAADPLALYLLDGLDLPAGKVAMWLDGLPALTQPALL